MTASANVAMIHRREIIAAHKISSRTFARWRAKGIVPDPDTDINAQQQWWKSETLAKAGIIMPTTEPTHAASPVVQ